MIAVEWSDGTREVVDAAEAVFVKEGLWEIATFLNFYEECGLRVE